MGTVYNAEWQKLGTLWVDFQERCVTLGLASISSINNMFERVGSVCAKPVSHSVLLNNGNFMGEQVDTLTACNQQWIEDCSNLIQVNILLQWELNDWSDQFAKAWVDALTPGINIDHGEPRTRLHGSTT